MKIIILFFYTLIIYACHKNSPLSPADSQERTAHAPFTYSIQEVLGVRKKTLQPIHLTFKEGTAHHCVSEPLLPQGLELSSDCVISGTPLFASSKQTYMLTASIGSTQLSTPLEITIQSNIRELIVDDGRATNVIFLKGYDGGAAYAILEDGTMMAWGRNEHGQLGIGNYENQNTPQSINIEGKVKTFIRAGCSTYALLEDGTVKAWGSNRFGQLGIGNEINQDTPQLIEGL